MTREADFEKTVNNTVAVIRQSGHDLTPYDIVFRMTSEIITIKKGVFIMATKKEEIATLEKTIKTAYKQAESLRKTFVLTEIQYKNKGVSTKSKTMENTIYKEQLVQDIKNHLSKINEDLFLIGKD